MKPVTLRLKLFATSLATLIFALIMAGFAISSLFADHVENNLKSDLSDQFSRLVALIDPQTENLVLKSAMTNPSFSIPHGGYYWQITDPVSNQRTRSRSMWDEEFNVDDLSLFDGREHIIRILDPEGTQAIAIIHRLLFDLPDGSSRTVDIIVARDLVHFDIAITKFRFDLFLSLLLLAGALSIAAWIQISLGLAPFKALKTDINSIRTGAEKRMSDTHPPEVIPLVEEMNQMLENQDNSINAARDRASNLAHSLKTHLSVLQTESENIREAGQIETADTIEKLGQDMHAIIDHQLRLSRLKTRTASDYFSTPLASSVTRLVNAVKRTPEGQALHWAVEIDNSYQVDIDTSDFFELLGIILENAAKWAQTGVEITALKSQDNICLMVRDDGPGLTPAQKKHLGKRGVRLDEQGTGSGIGLSIAAEIVSKNHGQIDFQSPSEGGLSVEICLLHVKKPSDNR